MTLNLCFQVFLSDDAPAYYTAWCDVMGPATHQLICSWHIHKKLTGNLTKITGGNVRAIVKQEITSLLNEDQEEEFEKHLENFIKKTAKNPATKSYSDYFCKMYARRTHVWALCYRKRLGIHTNVHLEDLHKQLKCTYLDGKNVRRLDRAIDGVLKIIRDSFLKRSFQVTFNTESSRMAQIQRNHEKGLEVPEDMICILETGKSWEVVSSRDTDTTYIVRPSEDNMVCPNNECPLQCPECNICVHTFQCTCSDYLIQVNICKHIHACMQFERETSPRTPSPSSNDSELLLSPRTASPSSDVDPLLELPPHTSQDVQKLNNKAKLIADMEKALEQLKLTDFGDEEDLSEGCQHVENLMKFLLSKKSFQEKRPTKKHVLKKSMANKRKKSGNVSCSIKR
uniref:SWIM-type domain-containing protein n=1 Tax=Cacopsylla melanoneura TaxID=428564 RepID=A0A8D8Z8V6_9HEMI